MMEDSFSVRVDKIFGGLAPAPAKKNSSSSSDGGHLYWRVTDEDIEPQKWNRRKDRQQQEEDDNELRQSAFVNPPPKPKVEVDEEDDDEDEEEEEIDEIDGAKSKRRRNNFNKAAASASAPVVDEDDWNVGANIGRDCTLDYEDEEDEYDKVAIGSEQNSGRFYMKDIKSTDDPVDELNTYDYLRDPSRYTRYTFDSSLDMDDNANKEAYMNTSQYLRKPNTEYSSEVKSVRFTPKNKRQGESFLKRNEKDHRVGENLKNKGWSVGVTAEVAQEHEVSVMEEDKPHVTNDNSTSLQKPSRQYRARN